VSPMPTQMTDVGKHDNEMIQTALSLVREKYSDGFLGAVVEAATDVQTLFVATWGCIGRGEMRTAITKADKLLQLDPSNEKYYYTRALAYARLARWRHALADYTSYLKRTQVARGAPLANAYYGRALCLAKLGHRAHALRDLDECIRVGPQVMTRISARVQRSTFTACL
jgi:tetratricopeptide (TPR) repeat protein